MQEKDRKIREEIFKGTACLHKIDEEKPAECDEIMTTGDDIRQTKKESLAEDAIETYELKRYAFLKKEIIKAKDELKRIVIIFSVILFGVLLFIGMVTVKVFIFNQNVNRSTAITTEKIASFIKQENNVLMNNIDNRLKIIANNQKLLNKKIIGIYNYQEEINSDINNNIKVLNNSVNEIKNYLKNEGKIMQIISELIIANNVELNKLIDKVYYQGVTRSPKNRRSEARKKYEIKKVKKEIKEETNSLIKKYENLLQELGK